MLSASQAGVDIRWVAFTAQQRIKRKPWEPTLHTVIDGTTCVLDRKGLLYTMSWPFRAAS